MPTISHIQAATALAFGVPLDAMLSQYRRPQIARARQVAMYLCRELTTRSLPEIGRLFGGRHHTTALHAIQVVPGFMAADPAFGALVDALRVELGGAQ